MGDRGQDGDRPAEAGDQAGSPEVWHGEDVERTADGEISDQLLILNFLVLIIRFYLSNEKERIVSTDA